MNTTYHGFLLYAQEVVIRFIFSPESRLRSSTPALKASRITGSSFTYTRIDVQVRIYVAHSNAKKSSVNFYMASIIKKYTTGSVSDPGPFHFRLPDSTPDL